MCAWISDLPGVIADAAALEADIEDMLSNGLRNESAYGEQTVTKLHQLRAPHWDRFFGEVRRVIGEVIAASRATLDPATVYLRAWASKLAREGDYSRRRARLSAIHNHSPAFLSAIYYLRVPQEQEKGESGTLFVNPFPQSLASPQPGVVLPGLEGRIVVFPSWVLHAPAELADLKSPRIVIAVDAHFIPE
ncbi:MAG TPA: putative 2OG-Fe(II) oxygenase [Bryobacteraceae bacterium]|nr:putative 2OG-Fe(II) oxygenase [Bryobacteraceae bacterium]